MGSNLGIKRETFAAPEDHSWLGSAHGTESTHSITLDGSAFTGTWADGVIPSGVVLGKITATGLYAPYDNAAVDGTQTALGHLFTTTDVTADGLDTTAAILDHGRVVEAKLPTDHGLDAAAKAELTQIRYA